MLLELKNISVYYEKAQALSNLSICANEGEIVTIIGANGAGKTTTLKAIAGLVRLVSGEIWFDGNRIDRSPPEKMVSRGISYAMEGKRLFPFMTVVENLEMGAYWRSDKDQIMRDMEDVFKILPRLKERQNQKAGTMSGGEQQMLTIARALMSKPKLLLLDEPSLGLAPKILMDVARVVKHLNEEIGLTVLIVEQNAQMALNLAHRGYVLEIGNITLEGDTQSLSGNPFIKRAYLGV